MTDIKALLKEIARPRMTGTSGAQEVSQLVRARLEALGYKIQEFPFTFSTLPGRFSVTAAGVVFLAGTLGSAWLLNQRHPGVALVLLLGVLFIAGALAVMTPALSSMLPFSKVSATNLLAAKPGQRPRYIVMAHLDSKSQPLPLAFRGPAIILAIVAWAALVIYAVLCVLDQVWIIPRVTTLLAVLCFIAGVLLVFCWTENRSPGALDNASGLATLLGVAEAERDRNDVAYLVTDAEELGLVGATAIARRLDPVIGVINIDGIDDRGTFFVLEKFGIPPRHIAPHLAAAILTAADEMSLPAQRRNVPFGLLLDHIPIARAGLPAVTIMRGTFASLRRVHRPGDSMAAMTGAGVESAIALVQRSLGVLRAPPGAPSL